MFVISVHHISTRGFIGFRAITLEGQICVDRESEVVCVCVKKILNGVCIRRKGLNKHKVTPM